VSIRKKRTKHMCVFYAYVCLKNTGNPKIVVVVIRHQSITTFRSTGP